MQFPITIGLRRSRFQGLAVMLAASLASATVLATPRSTIVMVAALLTTWLIAVTAWRLSHPAVSAIRLQRDGRLLIALPGEVAFHPAELLPGATVHPWLTVLRLRSQALGGRTLVLVLPFDALNAEDFRRLRVFLRWQAGFSDSGGDA